MILFKKHTDLVEYIDFQLLSNKKIGFVPTMGALHQGHISLVNESKKHTDITICSIFVNPTQFNNADDFNKYPITIAQDVEKLEEVNCTILFLPDVEEMYPNGTENLKKYEIGGLDIHLEGEFRPGHFQGVCNVVHRLLIYTKCHHLFMGAKDYQQCMVVNALIEAEKLSVQLHVCDTLRETSGLAMSSRNARLTIEGKENAAIIYQCLRIYKTKQKEQSFEQLKKVCDDLLVKKGFKLEYTILAHATNLSVLTNFSTTEPMVVLFAAWLDGVRLIDNLVISS